MDQLAKDACAAIKAGLTYGKYMAKKAQEPIEVKQIKKKKVGKQCALCGREFFSTDKRKNYCSQACSDEIRDRRRCERRKTEKENSAEG